MAVLWLRESGSGYDTPDNKYDAGYKFLFESKKIFLQMLRSFVRQGWVEYIDESSIVRLDKSFILQDFKRKEADLVYRVSLGDRDVIFYLLIELQSRVDFLMPYRLLLYMVEIWRSLLRDIPENRFSNKEYKLPVIVPCVLYSGKYNWTAGRSFGEYQNGFELFKDYALDFKYILIDVNRYEEEELLKLSNLIGSVFFIEQKSVSDSLEEIVHGLNKLKGVLDKLDEDDLDTFRTWLERIITVGRPKNEQEQIQGLLKKDVGVEGMMTNLEKAMIRLRKKHIAEGMEIGIEKGKEIGRLEGVQEGQRKTAINLLKAGLNIEQVAQSTELPLTEVQQLVKHLDKN